MIEIPIHWHPGWSEDHPVAAVSEGSTLVMYLSIEDAVRRAFSATPMVTLSVQKIREDFKAYLRQQFEAGQSIEGMRLIRKEGKG